MSETKWTPGPWQAVRSIPAEGADCWWICAGGGNREKELATVYAGSRTTEANAALIAAAPDLYEALRSVNKLISEAAMTGFNWKDGDWAQRLFDSQQQTSAALSRARANPQGEEK